MTRGHVRGARPWRFGVAALAAGLLLSIVSCDPCAGVANCTNGAYLAATGRIVDRESGRPLGGVRIDVLRVRGIGVAAESLSTFTDDEGYWRIELAPAAQGVLDADVRVAPAGTAGYRIRGLQLMTRLHGGDANLNQTWASTPYFNYALELFLRGTADERIQNRPVEFRLTGGVATTGTGVRDSVYRAVTDAGGRAEFFPQSDNGGLLPLDGADLIGDLTVLLAPPLASSVVRGIRLTPSYVYLGPTSILRLAVGP